VNAIGQSLKFLTLYDHKLSQAGGEQSSIREGNKTRIVPYLDLIEVAEFV
jgi:hypothetical protein